MEIDLLDGIGWRVCINVTDQTRFLVATDAHGLHCSTTTWAVYNVINSVLAVSNLIKCYLEYYCITLCCLLTLFSKYSFIPLLDLSSTDFLLKIVGISWCYVLWILLSVFIFRMNTCSNFKICIHNTKIHWRIKCIEFLSSMESNPMVLYSWIQIDTFHFVMLSQWLCYVKYRQKTVQCWLSVASSRLQSIYAVSLSLSFLL